MIKQYTVAREVLPEIESFIREHIGDLATAMDIDRDTEYYAFQAGQLQAYNTMFNLLTSCYKLEAPE